MELNAYFSHSYPSLQQDEPDPALDRARALVSDHNQKLVDAGIDAFGALYSRVRGDAVANDAHDYNAVETALRYAMMTSRKTVADIVPEIDQMASYLQQMLYGALKKPIERNPIATKVPEDPKAYVDTVIETSRKKVHEEVEIFSKLATNNDFNWNDAVHREIFFSGGFEQNPSKDIFAWTSEVWDRFEFGAGQVLQNADGQVLERDPSDVMAGELSWEWTPRVVIDSQDLFFFKLENRKLHQREPRVPISPTQTLLGPRNPAQVNPVLEAEAEAKKRLQEFDQELKIHNENLNSDWWIGPDTPPQWWFGEPSYGPLNPNGDMLVASHAASPKSAQGLELYLEQEGIRFAELVTSQITTA